MYIIFNPSWGHGNSSENGLGYSALIFYCCVTNYHKFKTLPHRFHGSGVQAQLNCAFCSVSENYNQVWERLCPFLEFEGPPPSSCSCWQNSVLSGSRTEVVVLLSITGHIWLLGVVHTSSA